VLAVPVSQMIRIFPKLLLFSPLVRELVKSAIALSAADRGTVLDKYVANAFPVETIALIVLVLVIIALAVIVIVPRLAKKLRSKRYYPAEQ
jgi:hypothetical protein